MNTGRKRRKIQITPPSFKADIICETTDTGEIKKTGVVVSFSGMSGKQNLEREVRRIYKKVRLWMNEKYVTIQVESKTSSETGKGGWLYEEK